MALTDTASGLKFVKGYVIQASRLADEFICLSLFLLNIGKVFILFLSVTSPFLFDQSKGGSFTEWGFSFGFWGGVFFVWFYLFLMGKKSKEIKLVFGSHSLSKLACFDESESIITEKLTVQLLISL